jgi:hypothetical protein
MQDEAPAQLWRLGRKRLGHAQPTTFQVGAALENGVTGSITMDPKLTNKSRPRLAGFAFGRFLVTWN